MKNTPLKDVTEVKICTAHLLYVVILQAWNFYPASQYQEHPVNHLYSRTNKFSFYYLCFSSLPKLPELLMIST